MSSLCLKKEVLDQCVFVQDRWVFVLDQWVFVLDQGRRSVFEWLSKHNRLRPEPIRFVKLDSEHAQSDGKSVNRDFRCWTWPEVAILGADQKERGLWGREWATGVTMFCTCAVTSRKKCHVSGCRRQAGDVCCLRCLFTQLTETDLLYRKCWGSGEGENFSLTARVLPRHAQQTK